MAQQPLGTDSKLDLLRKIVNNTAGQPAGTSWNVLDLLKKWCSNSV